MSRFPYGDSFEVWYLDNQDNEHEKPRSIDAYSIEDARRIVDDLIVGGRDINRSRARGKGTLRSTTWEIVAVTKRKLEGGTHQFE